MKVYKYILSAAIIWGGLMSSCTDEWDNHYNKQAAVINNEEMTIVDASAIEYLESQQSYSSICNLFKETGIFKEMEAAGVSYTLFVVDNTLMTTVRSSDDGIDEEKAYMAKSHITTASLSPNTIEDGQRLMMWNGKYVMINKTTSEENGSQEIIFNSNCKVKKVVKVNNGYVYELDNIIVTPKSLLETIEGLSDEYSIFKNAILSRNVKTFDRNNSLSIGVDESGNTVYDSVFTVKNPYFLDKGLDLASESKKITVLIPSDELIKKALDEGKAKLKKWKIERPDSILENWCFQAMFFKDVEYDAEVFNDPQKPDLTSAFGKQWRTTVNKVDLDNPVRMSNGIAYYVTSLKLPQKDVLIWRFKDLFKWFKYMDQNDKDKYFACTNLAPYGSGGPTRTEVKAWTPGYGWPEISNEYLWLVRQDANNLETILDFTTFKFDLHNDNTYDIEPYMIPPGEYTLHFGVGKNSNMKNDCSIYVNDKLVGTIVRSKWSSYSHDRGGGGAPEFYPSSLNNKYDRDGGEVGVFTIEGNEPVELRLKFVATHNGGTAFTPEHWCIRPTANCY